MNNRITFLSNVIILDVSFLNGTVADAKHVLEENLRRKLPDTDIVDWLICLALDAGLRGATHDIQVLFVVDEGVQSLKSSVPCSLS